MKPDKSFERYTKQVGLRHFRSEEEFEKYLRKRYGALVATSLLETITRRAHGEEIDIYELIHQSLSLSLDCLGAYQSTLHKNYIEWLLRQDFHPRRILDIGCGNGFLACFYGSLFPDSEIIGIDTCPAAIRCADELKTKLDTQNVRFIEVREDEAFASLEGVFDLITMVTMAPELFSVPQADNSLFMSEYLKKQLTVTPPQKLQRIESLLAADRAALVSVDRWSSYGYCWWTVMLQKSGFATDLRQSAQVPDESCGRKLKPATILVSQKKEKPVLADPDDIIGFWLFNKFRENSENVKSLAISDEVAEAGLLYINPKKFRFGIAVKDASGGIAARLEVWQAGPLVFVFQHGPGSHRVLEMIPSAFYSNAVDRVRALANDRPKGFTMSEYNEQEVDWDAN